MNCHPGVRNGTGHNMLGRTIHPGQQGGLHVMRDIPRYVKLIEKGIIDAQSVITKRSSSPFPFGPPAQRAHDKLIAAPLVV